MSFGMNDAGPQKSGELIPDGTFAKITTTIRRGGTEGQSELDRGLLKASGSVLMQDAKFTTMEGPYARRKLWQNFTVTSGKIDEQGVPIGWKNSKSTFRTMIDSALDLDQEYMSGAAKTKRILRGLPDLSGIAFVAKIKVEPSSDPHYSDSNKLDRVILPGEAEWRKVMDGENVPVNPSTRARHKATPAGKVSPAWGQPATPTPATGPRRGPHPRGTAPRNRTRPNPLIRRPQRRPRQNQRQRARPGPMAEDHEWQAQVTRGAAKAIGTCLEGRARLHQPSASMNTADLEAMASNAIARFVVMGSLRIRTDPEKSEHLHWLLSA